MRKSELIDAVAKRTGSTKLVAEAAVNAFVDTIQTAVAKGEKVTLVGFGSFEPVNRPARDFHNPATGERGRVPATTVPKFKVGADFRAAVKGARVPA
jgi:DNA-binding protein HU-beta